MQNAVKRVKKLVKQQLGLQLSNVRAGEAGRAGRGRCGAAARAKRPPPPTTARWGDPATLEKCVHNPRLNICMPFQSLNQQPPC